MGYRAPRGFWEKLGSASCAGGLLGGLIALDERVRDRLVDVISHLYASGLPYWGSQAAGVGNALAVAVESQSISHAPLLLFSLSAALLVVFMLRA